ncbi:6-phosphofructokinase [Metabacillus indicus]|uniref:6-phosphofructokinase n=1 Tax=Metabacillus indicus TaxID=246786 RepID=UPI002A08A375|nr:6-phosphofructokinase [Metabacillus indicus]MDX8288762.1 6-phosphofructokinase [Metabacillus indicus]
MRIAVFGIDTINETRMILAAIKAFAAEKNTEASVLEWHTGKLQAEPLGEWIRSIPEKTVAENKHDFLPVMETYDAVLVLGGSDQAVQLLSQAKTNVLFLPVSYLGDHALGYDTALNEVVTNVLKVKDTISSLLYMKQRVCCVQLPGQEVSDLMKDAAAAVEGYVVAADQSSWQHAVDYLRQKDEKGITYSFFIINESVAPQKLGAYLGEKMELDFKELIYDESQCMSSRPTAADRIIEKNLARAAAEWLESGAGTKQLVLVNKEVK